MINYNLQFFGGRGASAGLKRGTIIKFPNREREIADTPRDNRGLWDFKGDQERVEKLLDAVDKRWGMKSLDNLSLSLKKEEEHINNLIKQVESGENEGDVRNLMTLKRKIRQAQTKLKNKRGM